MSLNHIISQSRRRTVGPSLDLNFEIDKSNTSRVGPTLTFSRASSGTFVNKNGVIVGKTQSTSTINLNDYVVGNVLTFGVPSGSVVGWIVGSPVIVMSDTNSDDIHNTTGITEHSIQGNILSYTYTTLTLIVTAKTGTVTLTTPWVSYRGLRIDHDPVTGACLGALLESTRRNYAPLSASSPIGSWGTSNGTPIASVNSSVNPDGITRNNVILAPTGALNAGYNPSSGTTTVAAGTYTISVFAKYVNAPWMRLTFLSGGNANRVDAWFNVQTGAKGNITLAAGTAVTNFSHAVQASSNGWYRLSITATTTSVATAGFYIISADGENSPLRGSNMEYGLWGAQIEDGPFTSSFIPTTSTTGVVRASDSYTGGSSTINSFYNQNESTVYAKYKSRSTSYGTAWVISGPDRLQSSISVAASPYVGGSNHAFDVVYTSGAFATSAAFGINAPNHPRAVKTILAVQKNNFAATLDGLTPQTDSTGEFPYAAMTNMRLGGNDNASQFLNGHILAFTYYPRRLNNSQLQALTATVTEELLLGGQTITYINNTNTVTITI